MTKGKRLPWLTQFWTRRGRGPSSARRYEAALFLAAAAQIARLPLHPPTLIPYITYLPFVLLSAAYGGFWPGLLTTVLCFLEALYFATEPVGSLAVRDPSNWFGLGAFMLTGLLANILFERAKRARLASNLELTTMYASTPVALMVLDGDLRVRKANDMARGFAGPGAVDPVGQPLGGILRCLNALADQRGCGYGPTCSQCQVRSAALDSARNGISHKDVEAWVPVSIEGRVEPRYLSVSTGVIQADGERLILVAASDVTRLKKSEAALSETVRALESALAQKTVLLKEIHHRVKNNLAVISSLLSMKADTVEVKEAKEALEESQRRVFSIALIHEQLYGSDHLDRINFFEYARQLVEQLQSAFVGSPEQIDVVLDVAPIEIGIHRAVPCALILNELVSNAFKHAFPGERRGEVLVSLRESAPGCLELAIEDNGVGSPPGLVERNTQSLGLRIVSILSRQLEGSLEHQSATGAGTRFVLRFPAGSSRRAA